MSRSRENLRKGCDESKGSRRMQGKDENLVLDRVADDLANSLAPLDRDAGLVNRA